ncbi:MAG: ParA family protein [Ilumatobacteraceae bacterium]
MKVLATYSIKGGVGKTTAAVNLAYEASRTGARVLLWDLDPQGAATFFVRVEPALKGGADRLVSARGALDGHVRATDVPGLDVLPADFSLRHLDLHLDQSSTDRLAVLLDAVAPAYDVALLDCPPGITLTSESVFVAADALLVPTIPSTLSARTLEQLRTFLDGAADPPDVLPFVSMIDRRRTVHRDVAAALATEWPDLLPTQVPSVAAVERMGVARAPLGTYAPSSRGAVAFRNLWADIAAHLWPTA